MTYALSLILWMATAQTAGQPAHVPAPVVVPYVPSDNERALRVQLEEARAQLDEARDKLAKLEAESGMPDNAVAALLLSDRPELASLRRFTRRYVPKDTRWAQIDVYVSEREDETMVAVVVNLRNPRGKKTWEPTEAWVSAPFGPKAFASWLPPIPVAVRAEPQRILPGQLARIVVVFDKADLGVAYGPFKVGLQRDGKPEFEFELEPSDFRSMPGTGG